MVPKENFGQGSGGLSRYETKLPESRSARGGFFIFPMITGNLPGSSEVTVSEEERLTVRDLLGPQFFLVGPTARPPVRPFRTGLESNWAWARKQQ
jgi:hypothetical protein